MVGSEAQRHWSAGDIARSAFAGGTAGLAIVAVLSARLPGSGAIDAALGTVVGVFCAGVVLAIVSDPIVRTPIAFGAVAAFWTVVLAAALVTLGDPRTATSWVPAAEALTLALVACSAVPWRHAGRFGLAAVASAGVMLLLFGMIHLMQAADIAGLIPAWMPGRDHWPYATGAAMVVAGLAMAVPRLRRVAAFAMAAMFASWLLLVHLGRVLAAPAAPFEWEFALTAVCLSAALCLIASGARAGWAKRRETGHAAT